MTLFIGLLLSLSIFAQTGFAQSRPPSFLISLSLDHRLDSAEQAGRQSIMFPLSLFVPAAIRDGYAMRAYIVSKPFGEYDSLKPASQVFDEIFLTAEDYAHGRLTDALLAASYGAFEHENIPVTFLGAVIHVPLTHESHQQFLTRRSHLPIDLYHAHENDRDKIQHFYASAWLKSVLGMNWLVSLAGEFVEFMEGSFVVGSSRDLRDIHANHDGMRFAIKASGSCVALPSRNLTPNPESPSTDHTFGVPTWRY